MASGSQLSSVKCPLCNFYALSIQLVLSHLRLVHSSDPNFNVMCGISGCYKTSESFSALYQHIYKKHKDVHCQLNLLILLTYFWVRRQDCLWTMKLVRHWGIVQVYTSITLHVYMNRFCSSHRFFRGKCRS